MKEIYRQKIYIVLAKKITTSFGTFLLSLGSDHQFYIDFLTETGDFFVLTSLPSELLGEVWSGKSQLVESIEVI